LPIADSIRIRSGSGDYDVLFASDLASIAEGLSTMDKAVVVIDQTVHDLYRERMRDLLDRYPCYPLPATEEEKTLQGVERLLGFLQERQCGKESTLVVVGGGITQDIATISAHIYYRGIRFAFVPTTLLSMADSCIGAKCGINLHGFKNQIGVFHSPSRVVVCTRFLDTLSAIDVVSGYGEIVKLALTGSLADFEDLERTVDREGLRGESLPRLISMALRVKQAVIEEDEYEKDLRRILNYGHTFGHALESVTRHAVSHGVAVAWGLDLVNYIAVARGLLGQAHFDRIHAFVRRHFSPHMSSVPDLDDLIAATRRDKKNRAGRLTLILLEEPGRLKVHYLDYDASLRETVAAYLRLA
jgi:3-dehydroquinate synthase